MCAVVRNFARLDRQRGKLNHLFYRNHIFNLNHTLHFLQLSEQTRITVTSVNFDVALEESLAVERRLVLKYKKELHAVIKWNNDAVNKTEALKSQIRTQATEIEELVKKRDSLEEQISFVHSVISTVVQLTSAEPPAVISTVVQLTSAEPPAAVEAPSSSSFYS